MVFMEENPRHHLCRRSGVQNPEHVIYIRRQNMLLSSDCPAQICIVFSLLEAVWWGFIMSALRTPSVPSLERALVILDILADSHGGLTLSNLSKRAALPKSSIHSPLTFMTTRKTRLVCVVSGPPYLTATTCALPPSVLRARPLKSVRTTATPWRERCGKSQIRSHSRWAL